MKVFLVILLVLFLIWNISFIYINRVETPKYSVLEKKGEYEVRQYEKMIIAEVIVEGEYDESLGKGFEILAGYIFGNNVSKEKIAMTAPVTQSEDLVSEKIAMTAPVTVYGESGDYKVAFVMPSKFAINDLPIPNDKRITFKEVSDQKVAVRKFGWGRSAKKIKEETDKLFEALKRDNIEIVGEPKYAGYNAPWTPPYLARNEIIVEIR